MKREYSATHTVEVELRARRGGILPYPADHMKAVHLIQHVIQYNLEGEWSEVRILPDLEQPRCVLRATVKLSYEKPSLIERRYDPGQIAIIKRSVSKPDLWECPRSRRGSRTQLGEGSGHVAALEKHLIAIRGLLGHSRGGREVSGVVYPYDILGNRWNRARDYFQIEVDGAGQNRITFLMWQHQKPRAVDLDLGGSYDTWSIFRDSGISTKARVYQEGTNVSLSTLKANQKRAQELIGRADEVMEHLKAMMHKAGGADLLWRDFYQGLRIRNRQLREIDALETSQNIAKFASIHPGINPHTQSLEQL